MAQRSKSFTLPANGILRVLKTSCGATRAFNPETEKTLPKITSFTGLWDTGASGTVITKSVADKLSLPVIGKKKVYHAKGEDIVNEYVINLYLPNQVGVSFVRVTEGILNGTDILIGMDIISLGDFAITNFKGKSTFSFRIPSLEKIDFVADSKKIAKPSSVTKKVEIRRNDPCHCGSGKKFKLCHGRFSKN